MLEKARKEVAMWPWIRLGLQCSAGAFIIFIASIFGYAPPRVKDKYDDLLRKIITCPCTGPPPAVWQSLWAEYNFP